MPKTLNKKWILKLGKNYNNIHYRYCENLGNLTLTTFSSQKSSKTFNEKLSMNGGFKDDELYLNKSICEYSIWNEENILKRLAYLTETCLKIWPNPEY